MSSIDPKQNIVWHEGLIGRGDRERLNGHRGALLWFTGLSSAGKSTIAHTVEQRLFERGRRTFVLDGDNVRHGLCADLGFSLDDRHENIRRIGEVAKLFVDAGLITLTAFISPLRADRDRVRTLLGTDFLEIYCACPLEECERRDPKGLYRRARSGEVAEFTGISSPYEAPERPELVLETDRLSVAAAAEQVIALLEERGIVPARP